MPDTLAAPPAAPAAPVSTPAAPSTPSAPSTPAAPVSTPAAESTTVVSTPDSSAPVTTGGEPKESDFQSLEEFTRAHFAWQDEQAGKEPAQEADAAPVEEAPTDETAEQGDQPEPHDMEDEPESLTPEAISKLEASNPALKAVFDEHPEVKGQFYRMARENAKLAPIGELFPNLDSAKFANDTSARTVAIKTGFLQAANDPSKMPDAFQSFADEFREYGPDGNPVVDQAGNPVYGKDFEAMSNHVVACYLTGEALDIQEALKAGRYASEQAKDRAQTAIDALNYVKTWKDADPLDMERPDLSEMTDEQRSYFERREAEIKAKQEELGLRDKNQNAEKAKSERAVHNQKVFQTVNGEFGARLDQIIAEKKAANVNLPWFALDAKDTDGTSIFAKSVHKQFLDKAVGHIDPVSKKRVGGIPKVLNDFAILEAQPPSENVAKQRIELFRQLREEYMPNIVDGEIRKLQKADREQRAARAGKRDAAMKTVQPEPRTGSTPRPAAMNEDVAWAKARAEVAKDPKFASMTEGEREQEVMKKAALWTW